MQKFKETLGAVDIKIASFMALNFFSSTGIVVTNKIVMDRLGFKFATTLTFIHFTMTFLCLWICSVFKVFQIKKLPVATVSKLAAGSMGFVVLTNLSLQYNSIGFYQIMKVMTTPTVVILESLLYKKYVESLVKLTLMPIILGVCITSSGDYRFNLVGFGFASAGVVVTSFYQIWSGSMQSSLQCNALQLQFYSSALSALFIIPFVPIFDDWNIYSTGSIWYFRFTQENVAAILFTGVVAFLVNISIFLVIGKSSALTYNILGHSKTCFILVTDFLFFGRPLDLQNTLGVLFAVVGIISYTVVKWPKAEDKDKDKDKHIGKTQDSASVSVEPEAKESSDNVPSSSGERAQG